MLGGLLLDVIPDLVLSPILAAVLLVSAVKLGPPRLGTSRVVAGCVALPAGSGLCGDGFDRRRAVAEHAGDDRRWCLLEQVADGSGAAVEVGDAQAV